MGTDRIRRALDDNVKRTEERIRNATETTRRAAAVAKELEAERARKRAVGQ